MLSKYEKTLLEGWEEVHKRGQLTLWILLALKDGPKRMADIKHFIHEVTNNILTADDKSLYRALRRYTKAEMLGFKTVPSKNGPDLKVYHLTDVGNKVLSTFLERNVIKLFFSPTFKQLIEES
jgi:PadR family transcriptional regulator PadR